jgi:hypothetical protein
MLALAGCTFFAPQATLIQYDPSDGVGITVGSVALRNAFVISPDGQDANLVGSLINTSGGAKTVRFQYTSNGKSVTTTVDLPASGPNGAIAFGNSGVKQVVFTGTKVKPGSLLRVFMQYGSKSGKSVLLPVLSGSTLKAYSTLTPSPTPSATSSCSISNTGEIVGCPTPTPTPTPTSTTVPN